MYSERDKEIKTYDERIVKPETHIVAPDHAPNWVYDREKLWNEVENVEKNYNSRLAREILVALPVELDRDKQTQMLLEFVKENFVSSGMVADISIHRDKEHNPHAHIMLTTRPFNENGTWGNKKRKEYFLDENGNNVLDKTGRKTYKTYSLTDWDSKETLLSWRKSYAEKINLWYEQEGLNDRVSHESYEEQGIEKLPKQRLSLWEYHFEKREQENAKRENKPYEPKTYYGKLNQEIEIQNNKIEDKNKRIVSLEKYRERVLQEAVEPLDQIRKSKNLSSEDILAIKTVAVRVSGYVDYKNAKDNLNRLSNWKKKIDLEKRMLEARRRVLAKAKEGFKARPTQALLYGIQPNKFEEQFTKLIQDLKEDTDKFNNLMNVYNDLYEKSLRVFDIQRYFVHEEFNYLYSEYENAFVDSDEALNVKAKYVSLYKQEGIIRDSIPEFEGDTKKYHKDYEELSKLVNDWKEINKSLVVLERTKEKRREEYRDLYKNNYESSKVYNASIRYTDARDLVSLKEGEKAQITSKVLDEMVKRYPDVSADFIKQIPTRIQSKLLELHLKDEHVGQLSKDLELVKQNKFTKREIGDYRHDFNSSHDELGSSSIANAGETLNELINVAKDNEKANDEDLERYRKSRKTHNRRSRGIDENER